METNNSVISVGSTNNSTTLTNIERIVFTKGHTYTLTLADAAVLTDLSYKTFRDAFADHPKNAPDDLAHLEPLALDHER